MSQISKRKSSGASTRNSESTTSTDACQGEEFSSIPNENENDSFDSEIKIPNRVFIGGLSCNTDEWDIRTKFCKYGYVKFVKIIRDNMGASKGYGFVTFGTEQEAKKVIKMADITIKGRKLNIGAAVKKIRQQSNSHSSETSSGESANEEVTSKPKILQKHPGYQPIAFNGNTPYVYEIPGYFYSTALRTSSKHETINSQVSYALPYGAFVYIPQYPYQHPTTGYAYSIGGSCSELVPITVPAAGACCFSTESV